jgi:hypothetical protein
VLRGCDPCRVRDSGARGRAARTTARRAGRRSQPDPYGWVGATRFCHRRLSHCWMQRPIWIRLDGRIEVRASRAVAAAIPCGRAWMVYENRDRWRHCKCRGIDDDAAGSPGGVSECDAARTAARWHRDLRVRVARAKPPTTASLHGACASATAVSVVAVPPRPGLGVTACPKRAAVRPLHEQRQASARRSRLFRHPTSERPAGGARTERTRHTLPGHHPTLGSQCARAATRASRPRRPRGLDRHPL